MRDRIISRDEGRDEFERAAVAGQRSWLALNDEAPPGAEPPYEVDEFTDLGTWHRVGIRAGVGVTLS